MSIGTLLRASRPLSAGRRGVRVMFAWVPAVFGLAFARRAGLANRVTVAFALISLVVALVVSGATYFGARVYLVQQRETAALNRALIDARVVDAALTNGEREGKALERLPLAADSQAMLRVGNQWFASNVTVPPRELPPDLLSRAENGGAWQRFEASTGTTYLAIAIPVSGGIFVETFSFEQLDQTLAVIAWVLVAAAIAALFVGGLVGRYVGRKLLRPLGALADSARRITEGDLRARVPTEEDPDLAAISNAFNEMADAVQNRLERERRFSANVSHELRSPLTGILGTADLLENRIERMPKREATLVQALNRQVRRFSATVLDLLEISRIGGDTDVRHEAIDTGLVIDDLLAGRGLDLGLRHGEDVLLLTDPRRFERIVGNLIDNAQRHGDGVTAVTVERDGATVRLIVDDAGAGIPEDLVGQIFEPFARGDSTSQDGAGLGLAIVREQVRLLGGTIAVDRSPQDGARFVVEIPNRSQP